MDSRSKCDQRVRAFGVIATASTARPACWPSGNTRSFRLVKAGAPAPGGANYTLFWAPHLNNHGEVAYFSDLDDVPGSAWFAGHDDAWRRVLAFGDEIEGGHIVVLAVSRNPMQALADNGDFVAYARRQMPDESEVDSTLLFHPDGAAELLAVQGEASPVGGIWGWIDGWPSISNRGQVRIGSTLSGFGSADSADVIVNACPGNFVFRDGFDA